MADIEKITTASSKGQITVPQEFRDALGIAKGTKLVCKIKGGELRVKVVEAHLQAMGDDPVLGQFLGLVSKDITSNGTLFDMPRVSHLEWRPLPRKTLIWMRKSKATSQFE